MPSGGKTSSGSGRPPAVAVAGASGVLGREVVARLVERGCAVTVLVRDDSLAAWFGALGCRRVRGDLLVPEGLAAFAAGADCILHLATAIPVPGGAFTGWALNDRIRREGTANLVAAARQAGVRRFVLQSVALLHATPDGGLGDETTPFAPVEMSASAVDMEAIVRGSGLDWRILRGGAFYGLDSGRDRIWRDSARAGTLRYAGDGRDFISLVHVSDMAEAVARATLSDRGNLAAIVVDDEPVTYRDLFGHIARACGAPPPSGGGALERPSFRLRADLARGAWGWRPHFSTYRSGILPGRNEPPGIAGSD